MFTNNILNDEQVKQIEENSSKPTNIPLFNSNKFFDKSANNFLGLNTNSILKNISTPNIFTKEMQLFNQAQPKINLDINNINNQDTENIINNNSLNLFNNNNIGNNVNEIKNKNNSISNANSNKNLFSTSKVDDININKQINNSFNIPMPPSFLNKEEIKKNALFINSEKTEKKNINKNIINMNDDINKNLNQNINNNIDINAITNNEKKNYNNFFKGPLIAQNPNNNFINEFTLKMNKLLFQGMNQFPFISPINNNFLSYPINYLNNNKPISMNIPQDNSIKNGNINPTQNMQDKSE